MVLSSEALCEINNRTVYDLLAFILFFLFYIFSLKIHYKLVLMHNTEKTALTQHLSLLFLIQSQ